jgi:hypothetical protein
VRRRRCGSPAGLAQGELIQAHAYAQDGARARYVYLDPEPTTPSA